MVLMLIFTQYVKMMMLYLIGRMVLMFVVIMQIIVI